LDAIGAPLRPKTLTPSLTLGCAADVAKSQIFGTYWQDPLRHYALSLGLGDGERVARWYLLGVTRLTRPPKTQGRDQILRLALMLLNHQTRIAPTTTTRDAISTECLKL